MPDIFHKVAGAWKKTSALSVKVAGAWKNVPSAWVKVAGAWKLVYQAGGGGGVDMGDILRSVRFRAAANGSMARTFAAPTLQNTFTWSAWVKRGALGTLQYLFSCAANGVRFTTTDSIELFVNNAIAFTSAEKFRDPSAWMHVHWRQNGSGSELWVNGALLGSTAIVSTAINSAVAHNLGSLAAASYLNGYFSRICFVDGLYLAASDFGLANSAGTWISKSQADVKALADGGGNNSSMLEFDTGAALANLGNDFSDNNNDWTVNAGISITAGPTYDWMTDTPSDNHATLDVLDHQVVSIPTFAGLRAVTGTASYGIEFGTIPLPASGKWAYEIDLTDSASRNCSLWFGAASRSNGNPQETNVNSTYNACVKNEYSSATAPNRLSRDNVLSQSGVMLDNTDKCMVLFDVDADTVQFVVDGNATAVFPYDAVAKELRPFMCDISATYGSTFDFNFGQRPFSNVLPVGFLPLSAANLPDIPITMSGSFTGNANANGPVVWLGGVPKTMTINGNAVTWGTHADKLAGGFKVRSAAAGYNAAGANAFTVTLAGAMFKYANAQVN